MIGARLRGARELREDDDRDVELLGQSLERAGNRAELERAVLEPAATRHQLDVVHHEQVEPVLRLETPGLGPHLEHPDAGGVVDEETHRAERFDGVRDPPVVLLPDGAAHQPVAVDLGL
ncbi:hypothetical protein D3C83_32860 [compost metagenome]